MIRYRNQTTKPTWPDWSEPNAQQPTTYIPVGLVTDDLDSLVIDRPEYDADFRGEPEGAPWEVWEPAVALDFEGRANEAECRAYAAAFLAAADALAKITAGDNEYPLEQE